MSARPADAAGRIGMRGTTFRDAAGRHVILRGVNFSGDSKVPVSPDGRTHLPTDFADHRTVNFVGRPAPLDELDGHLARLRLWGFNCLRLLTTWEAIEHAGPGRYDEAYLDYFAEVCRRAGRYGLHVFIDLHQDAWSRMSGGDGAPGWTFAAAGLDLSKFSVAGAVHLMQDRYDHRVGGRQDGYPVMSWSGNYARGANGVMWTLFFAGADFAPSAVVDGRNVQAFLQDHYLGAMHAVAARVADMDHVIGFDTLNEPGTGYIGKRMSDPLVRYRGPVWTALDSLAVASGFTRDLPVVAPGRGVVGNERLNEDRVGIWLPGHDDPFRAAGAWDVRDGVPVVGDEAFFHSRGGREVDLACDYMAPFFRRVADTIRATRPDWLVFAETDPFETGTHGLPPGCPERSVNAAHWYDFPALTTKRFDPAERIHPLTGRTQHGERAIEDAYVGEMASLAAAGAALPGGAPTLLGECGIHYDMNDADAYRRWDAGERTPEIWQAQTVALDLMYNAIDRLLLSSTQWNYTVGNRNDPMIGDGWNQEDLSIWSADQITDPADPASGGRAVEGFCRPYVRAAQGTLVSQRYDRATGTFEAVVEVDPSIAAATEVFVPDAVFPDGCDRDVRGPGSVTIGDDAEGQRLHVRSGGAGRLAIRLVRR